LCDIERAQKPGFGWTNLHSHVLQFHADVIDAMTRVEDVGQNSIVSYFKQVPAKASNIAKCNFCIIPARIMATSRILLCIVALTMFSRPLMLWSDYSACVSAPCPICTWDLKYSKLLCSSATTVTSGSVVHLNLSSCERRDSSQATC